MSEYQHRARKRFGQNFLHDAGVIHRILDRKSTRLNSSHAV